MEITDLSFTFHTQKIKECVEFYEKYLGARLIFDCGWYVTLRLAGNSEREITLSLIHPAHSSTPMPEGAATLNLMVEEVDAAFEALRKKGMKFLREASDQPWGDRSFTTLDPIGNILYIYSPRPLNEDYLQAVK